MRSLLDLNTFGQTPFDVPDNRTARAKFDRVYPLYPLNQNLTISSTEVTVSSGINIKEVINYSLANVRYSITIIVGDVNPLVGSTISWSSLPSGITLEHIGNTYTLSGINSVQLWNLVKSFTWNLPVDYSSYPKWFLRASIFYYDESDDLEKTITWDIFDSRFYSISDMTSSTSMNIEGEKLKLFEISISDDSSQMLLNASRYKGIILNLDSEFSISIQGSVKFAEIESISTLNVTANIVSTSTVELHLINSLECNAIIPVTNLYQRSFLSNQENNLFSTDYPVLFDESSYQFATRKLKLECSNGYFSRAGLTPSKIWYHSDYSSSLENINTMMQYIKFYPDKDFSGDTVVTLSWYKNDILIISRSFILSGNYSVGYTGETHLITSNQTFTPSFKELLYCGKFDIVLCGGGGGGGGYNGGGGGAGGYISLSNQILTNQSYSLIIGSGGSSPGQNTTGNGGQGGDTSGFGQIAYGGQGGKGYFVLDNYPADYPTQPIVYRWNHSGGASGYPTYHAGGSFTGVSFTYNYSLWNGGAGGGGRDGSGSDGSEGAGGAGGGGTGAQSGTAGSLGGGGGGNYPGGSGYIRITSHV